MPLLDSLHKWIILGLDDLHVTQNIWLYFSFFSFGLVCGFLENALFFPPFTFCLHFAADKRQGQDHPARPAVMASTQGPATVRGAYLSFKHYCVSYLLLHYKLPLHSAGYCISHLLP